MRKKGIWIEVNDIPKNVEHRDKLIISSHKFIRKDRLTEAKNDKILKKMRIIKTGRILINNELDKKM